MLVTELQAKVPADKWDLLRRAYDDLTGRGLPIQMVSSALLQSASDGTVWRIVSTWKSQAALEEYRASVETPEGVRLFRSVGGEPVLALFEVARQVAAAE